MNFKKMKVAELKTELENRQIDIPRGAKKAELLALLMSSVEAEGASGDAPADDITGEMQDENAVQQEEEAEQESPGSEQQEAEPAEEVMEVEQQQQEHAEVEQPEEEEEKPAVEELQEPMEEQQETAADEPQEPAEEQQEAAVEEEASPANDDVEATNEQESQEQEEDTQAAAGCSQTTEEEEEEKLLAVDDDELSSMQQQTGNNDDIVELEEPGMQDLDEENDNKQDDEADKVLNENETAETTATDGDEKAVEAPKPDGEEAAAASAEKEEKTSEKKEGDKSSRDRRGSAERGSRDRESRRERDHENRKRRHEDSRSKRDDERFAPPPEEPEEEFDDNLVVMDKYNCSLNIKLHQKRCTVQALTLESFAYIWASSRATYGVTKGKVYYECKVVEEHSVRHMPHSAQNRHCVRVGWSDNKTQLLIGEAPMSFAYCSTGKSVTDKTCKEFGSAYKEGDVIGCYLDMSGEEEVTMTYTKNGEVLGAAFTQEKSAFEDKPMFPHITCKNVTVEFNFGQKEEAYFASPEELKEYQFIGSVAVEDRVRGLVGPDTKKECEVLMLCGLPGAGKSHYATKLAEEHPEKFYNIIGSKWLIASMSVSGQASMKRDQMLSHANSCLNRVFQIACRKKRNYIIDQTNVFTTARRKMRMFEGFNRKALIMVPTDEDYKTRQEKRYKEEGKDIPDHAITDMKANFSFPTKGDLFEEVEFLELKEEEADKQIAKYREEARKRGPPPEKRFRGSNGGGGFFNNPRGMRNQWGGNGGGMGGGNFDFPKNMGGGRMGGMRGPQRNGSFGNMSGGRNYGGMGGNNRNGSGDRRHSSGGFNNRGTGQFNKGGSWQQNRNSFGGSGTGGGARGGYGSYNKATPSSNNRSNGGRQGFNNRNSGGGAGRTNINNRNNTSRQQQSFDYHRAYQQQTAQIAAAAAQQHQVAAAAAAVPSQQQSQHSAAAAAAYSQAYAAQGQNDYSQQWAQYYQQQAAAQQQQQQQQAVAAAAAAQYQNYYAYQQAFSGQK